MNILSLDGTASIAVCGYANDVLMRAKAELSLNHVLHYLNTLFYKPDNWGRQICSIIFVVVALVVLVQQSRKSLALG